MWLIFIGGYLYLFYIAVLTNHAICDYMILTLISHNRWLGCDVCACKLLMQRSWLGFAGGKGMVAGGVRVGRKRDAFGAGCDAGGNGADL